MGGWNSGRPSWRMKAEHCRSLDVNRLHRYGCLELGYRGGWEWKRDAERVAWISLRAEEDALVLLFRWRYRGGEWEDVIERVPLVRAPCRYGGERPYFVCPSIVRGRHCGRRVAKLYAGGRYFLCRHCYGLTYASHSEEGHDRLLRRANKLRARLGGEPGMDAFIGRRPKGMWQRTYDRIVDEIIKAEEAADRAFLARFRGRLPDHDLADLLE